MGVGEDFRTFCSTLTIVNRSTVAARCGLLTRRLNLHYWDDDSSEAHAFYSGSYGRGTATRATSDVDMVFKLPAEEYYRFNAYQTNGQSGLLRDVRQALLRTYPSTRVGSDGQVVVVPFTDQMTVEVLPVFWNRSKTYTYPNANGGGVWGTTDPKAEIEAFRDMDAACNGNLKWLCRMARAWRDVCGVAIGGMLLDTLAYYFIREWEHSDKAFLYYDWMSRDFFDYLSKQDRQQRYWKAPGSGQWVYRKGLFEWKAASSRNTALLAIRHESRGQHWAARRCWRIIYGTGYPLVG